MISEIDSLPAVIARPAEALAELRRLQAERDWALDEISRLSDWLSENEPDVSWEGGDTVEAILKVIEKYRAARRHYRGAECP